jgi:molecular chaperone GrpE (heat shock protein)
MDLATVKDGFLKVQQSQEDLEHGWEVLNAPAKEEKLEQLNQELADWNARLARIEKHHENHHENHHEKHHLASS